jgi:hypothetical protein
LQQYEPRPLFELIFAVMKTGNLWLTIISSDEIAVIGPWIPFLPLVLLHLLFLPSVSDVSPLYLGGGVCLCMKQSADYSTMVLNEEHF